MDPRESGDSPGDSTRRSTVVDDPARPVGESGRDRDSRPVPGTFVWTLCTVIVGSADKSGDPDPTRSASENDGRQGRRPPSSAWKRAHAADARSESARSGGSATGTTPGSRGDFHGDGAGWHATTSREPRKSANQREPCLSIARRPQQSALLGNAGPLPRVCSLSEVVLLRESSNRSLPCPYRGRHSILRCSRPSIPGGGPTFGSHPGRVTSTRSA